MNKQAFQPIQPISFIQKQATCKKTTYTAKVYIHIQQLNLIPSRASGTVPLV